MTPTPTLLLVAMLLLQLDLFGQCAATIFTPIENRIAQSDIIIEGKVVKKECFWGPDDGLIYTENTIKIFKVFKGSLLEDEISVSTLGGTINEESLSVFPSLNLSIGDIGVFLLRHNKAPQNSPLRIRPVADGYSSLKYDLNLREVYDGPNTYEDRSSLYQTLEKQTHRKHELKNPFPKLRQQSPLAMPSISNFIPTTADGGKGETITINGSNFGSVPGTVFFDDPDDGSGANYRSVLSGQILFWSSSQIVVEVPSKAGTGLIAVRDQSNNTSFSSQTLTVNYSQSNVTPTGSTVAFEPELIDDNGTFDEGEGYFFQYSTSTANNGVDITSISSATAAIERAIDTWQAGTGLPFYVGSACGTTTSQIPGDDDVNIISFDSDAWDLDVQVSSSTLATMFSWYSKCGVSDWEVSGLDMIIRRDGTGVDWEYGPSNPSFSERDFESVILHEFGHGTQLQHVNTANALMSFGIGGGTTRRTLGTINDIAGSNYVLGHSLSYNPPIIACTNPDFTVSRQLESFTSTDECAQLFLPVELLSFEGREKIDGILLKWATSTEINNDYFTLERSKDGRSFSPIITKKGAGTVYIPQAYQFLDTRPFPGINYYRLKQTDFDGSFEYFKTVAVSYRYIKEIQVSPNPVTTGQLQIDYTSATDQPIYLSLWSASGQLVFQDQQAVSEGYQQMEIDMTNFAKGIYFLRLQQGEQTDNFRLIR